MRTSENIVSSFFYYMWNAWCEEECRIVFASVSYPHFWEKWCAATHPTVNKQRITKGKSHFSKEF